MCHGDKIFWIWSRPGKLQALDILFLLCLRLLKRLPGIWGKISYTFWEISTSEWLSEEQYSTACSMKSRRNRGLCAPAGKQSSWHMGQHKLSPSDNWKKSQVFRPWYLLKGHYSVKNHPGWHLGQHPNTAELEVKNWQCSSEPHT